MKIRPPFKLSVLRAVVSLGEASARDVVRTLASTYPGERQLREAAIENHLLSLRAVGLVELHAQKPDAPAVFTATPQGLARLNLYLPGK